MTQHEGSLIAADEETIAGKSDTPVSPLVSMLGLPAGAAIDIINDDNADHCEARLISRCLTRVFVPATLGRLR